jgi:hypothetical protein
MAHFSTFQRRSDVNLPRSRRVILDVLHARGVRLLYLNNRKRGAYLDTSAPRQ